MTVRVRGARWWQRIGRDGQGVTDVMAHRAHREVGREWLAHGRLGAGGRGCVDGGWAG